jgi:hypothetical protein
VSHMTIKLYLKTIGYSLLIADVLLFIIFLRLWYF